MELSKSDEQINEIHLEGRRATVRAACLSCGIPPHMHEAIVRYVVDHEPVGGFLTAILENDFMEAAKAADHMNINAFRNYANLFYNHLPYLCYGSPVRVERWLNRTHLDEK
jgi:hypothetical protein